MKVIDKNNQLWRLLDDLSTKKGITEIAINDPGKIFVERDGQFIQLNTVLDEGQVESFIQDVAKINNKICNQENPILDGRTPDGSRVNIIRFPYTRSFPAITIRRYIQDIKNFHSRRDIFGLNKYWIDFFKALVLARVNVIVSGGTGVGKTTFLNLLLNEIPPVERVVTIEDTFELNFSLPNLVSLEFGGKNLISTNPLGARELVKNTLRMRPDRIIIGEVRGGEIFDLLQAMNTGHDGSMTSVHSSSPGECFNRLESLYLLAGFDAPSRVVKKQISMGVDFIVQLSRLRDGRRVVSQILEVTGMEGDNILSQVIADFSLDEGLKLKGLTPENATKLYQEGGLKKGFFNE